MPLRRLFLLCSKVERGLATSVGVCSVALGLLVRVIDDVKGGLRKFSAAGKDFLRLISSARARQSSVKLRQMLSAFRRNCLSVTPPLYPMELAALEIGPGCPGAPIIEERANASMAALSMALKTSELTCSFVLLSAERRRGCTSRVSLLGTCFGEVDMVVALVVAVRGRSSETRDVVGGGMRPVSSSLWILDFKSSNSSQTDDGSAEVDESVVSELCWASSFWLFLDWETKGEEALKVRLWLSAMVELRYGDGFDDVLFWLLLSVNDGLLLR